MKLAGYRNSLLILLALVTSTFLIRAGIEHGVDLYQLAWAIGVKDGALVGGVAMRALNKKAERPEQPPKP
jgi:hypothetical protein